MSTQGAGQFLVYVGVLLLIAYPLGLWMTRVYGQFRAPGLLGATERGFYRLLRTDPDEEQDWRSYGLTMLVFTAVGTILLYVVVRAQAHLGENPDGMKAMPPQLALNTAASFVTNTSWQFYGG